MIIVMKDEYNGQISFDAARLLVRGLVFIYLGHLYTSQSTCLF